MHLQGGKRADCINPVASNAQLKIKEGANSDLKVNYCRFIKAYITTKYGAFLWPVPSIQGSHTRGR